MLETLHRLVRRVEVEEGLDRGAPLLDFLVKAEGMAYGVSPAPLGIRVSVKNGKIRPCGDLVSFCSVLQRSGVVLLRSAALWGRLAASCAALGSFCGVLRRFGVVLRCSAALRFGVVLRPSATICCPFAVFYHHVVLTL